VRIVNRSSLQGSGDPALFCHYGYTLAPRSSPVPL
jgi:hypothetical protein